MNLDEALAVYLYLAHAQRNSRQNRAFSEAWGVICQEAEKQIARQPEKQGDYA